MQFPFFLAAVVLCGHFVASYGAVFDEDFNPAESVKDCIKGEAFKLGVDGLGCYVDRPPPSTVPGFEYDPEEEARKEVEEAKKGEKTATRWTAKDITAMAPQIVFVLLFLGFLIAMWVWRRDSASHSTKMKAMEEEEAKLRAELEKLEKKREKQKPKESETKGKGGVKGGSSEGKGKRPPGAAAWGKMKSM